MIDPDDQIFDAMVSCIPVLMPDITTLSCSWSILSICLLKSAALVQGNLQDKRPLDIFLFGTLSRIASLNLG
jgi:hypothetical protein